MEHNGLISLARPGQRSQCPGLSLSFRERPPLAFLWSCQHHAAFAISGASFMRSAARYFSHNWTASRIPALKAVFPALASQFILLLLGSSVVSAISANELTAIANTLQSTTFRAFEVYIVVTIMYLAIAVAFRGLFALTYWHVFVRGRE
jgi:hypothetical protein